MTDMTSTSPPARRSKEPDTVSSSSTSSRSRAAPDTHTGFERDRSSVLDWIGWYPLVILAAVVMNALLLGIIGYFNKQELMTDMAEETWSVQTVDISPPEPSTASKDQPEREKRKEKTTTRKKVARVNTKPQNVGVRTDGLQMKGISTRINGLDLGTEGLGAEISAPRGKPEGDQSDETGSGGSEGKKKGFKEGKLDQLPERTGGSRPSYPSAARQNGVEGWVKLRMTVSKEGKVLTVRVIDWKGAPSFKREAKEAVEQWTFQPGKVDGRPVKTKGIIQRFSFQIGN